MAYACRAARSALFAQVKALLSCVMTPRTYA